MSQSDSGHGGGAGEMDQWVTVPADEPPNLSSIPETHIERGRTDSHRSSSDSTRDAVSLVE